MDRIGFTDLIERHHLRFHYPYLELRGIRFRAVAGCACGLEFRLLAAPLRAWAEHVAEVLLYAIETDYLVLESRPRGAVITGSSEPGSPR